jgi:hypothetical protein
MNDTMTVPNDPSQFIELSADDARLLDELVECGFDPAALATLAAEDRARAAKLTGLLALLNDYPVEDGDDTLVNATLARVQRYEDQRAERLRMEASAASSRRFRMPRMPDFVSAAAIVLIATGIGWPVLSQVRSRSLDSQCGNNMRSLATAFASYAGDFEGAMPLAVAGFPGASWDRVPNILNLEPLIDGGYCQLGHLNCPGDHHQRFSYSYQHQPPGTRSMWGIGPRSAALADRNPIIDAVRRGMNVPPLSMSNNHASRGQNVLFQDGSVEWLTLPTIGNDNIWLPQGFDHLDAGANASGPSDSFLTH